MNGEHFCHVALAKHESPALKLPRETKGDANYYKFYTLHVKLTRLGHDTYKLLTAFHLFIFLGQIEQKLIFL